MVDRLFVYGTLGPGRPHEQVLLDIGGTWEPATVRGTLRQAGWGADLGYPGIDLDETGAEVDGVLFHSENLTHHWATLDEFEGEAYRRVLVKARRQDGTTTDAYVYSLKLP